MEFIILVAGALLGVILDRVFQYVSRRIASRNPLRIEVSRSPKVPSWYATNRITDCSVPVDISIEEEVRSHDPFCGFARMAVEVTNTSKEIVYIDNISPTATSLEWDYCSRVRFMSQGVSRPVNLLANLDDNKPVFMDGSKRPVFHGKDFFSNETRIKIAPGETELIVLAFITTKQACRFNASLRYTVGGKSRTIDSVFKEDEMLVPYAPDTLKHDYCGFLLRNAPEDHREFSDAGRFSTDSTPDTLSNDVVAEKESASEYLSRLALG